MAAGNPSDPRIAPAREAIGYWNRELRRLERAIHLDSLTVRADSIPDDLLRAVSGEAVMGGGPATTRLVTTLSDAPADILIVLSQTDLISFGVPWREKRRTGTQRRFHDAHVRASGRVPSGGVRIGYRSFLPVDGGRRQPAAGAVALIDGCSR